MSTLHCLTSWTWTAGVQHFHVDSFEYFHQLLPQLLVALINVSIGHDVERGSHQSKQSGVEVDGAVSVEPHVHGDESLAGHSVGTELPEPEWRRYLPEQCHHVNMLDPALGVWVVLGPEGHELPQVVGPEDGPVTGEIVKVVHDDGHKQVEDKEGAEDEETDEVNVGKVRAATSRGPSIIRLGIEISSELINFNLKLTHVFIASDVWMFDHGQHDLLPGLSGGAPEQEEHGPAEGLEVVVPVHVGVVVQGNPTKDLHPDHAVDEEDKGDEDGDPGQGLEGLEEGPEESSDALIFV